ncbi:MAG TPA: polyphosphate kinase 1 [Actinomycetota bacterium]|nr:polyphosphate kinase 1 [Actinomycetota bacterium]
MDAPIVDEETPEAPPLRMLNRHLSWLDFDARVLALAEDEEKPLLDRAKFLAIFSTNLDEFFQVRVAELDEQADAGIRELSPDGRTPPEQLGEIRERARELVVRAGTEWRERIRPALAEEGIAVSGWDELADEDRKALGEVFFDQIFPVLTPLAVDPTHPFPYISNLSLNVAVMVRDPEGGQGRFARIKVPPLLPRFHALPDGRRWVPIERIIEAHLDSLFPGMDIEDSTLFRVTRNQDPELGEDEVLDLRRAVESLLRERRRSQHAVRLEIDADASDALRDLLVDELELEADDVDPIDGLIDHSALWELYGLSRPELKEDPWSPVTPARLKDGDIFTELRNADLLVHHPNDDFATTVAAFLRTAAEDPRVLTIKQTLYRTSGSDQGIVAALARAADAGKQVVALVELTARFDEERNIEWARALEQAGAHVVYGVVGLKTHAKISLVVRREPDGIRRYAHVGTGNYNSTTARIYEDIGLLTADEDISSDVAELFNYLTGFSRERTYRKLLVAPSTLRPGLEAFIREQSRPGGRIVMKANGLVDSELIELLYEASQAGAKIDLIVRGICCLVPGVPGQSENIRVRSFVGRYLEHSRIFRFGSDEEAKYLIGSGDLMPRNLDRRVEALTPVEEQADRERLDEILGVYLSKRVGRWELDARGEWHHVRPKSEVDAQRRLYDLAVRRARSRRRPAPRSAAGRP